MAFDIDYIAKSTSSANSQGLNTWRYNATASGTNEALATVVGSGYFNAFMQNLTLGTGPLKVGDWIQISANDDYATYIVTAVTTNVTLAASAVAPDSISTASIQDDAVTTAKIADLNVTTGKLAADAVDNTKLADAAVSLENLDAGITPSHVARFGAQYTTTGGGAAEAITVTGAAATDLAFVGLLDDGSNNVSILSWAVTVNTLTVTFSADPGNDAIINYVIMNAAS